MNILPESPSFSCESPQLSPNNNNKQFICKKISSSERRYSVQSNASGGNNNKAKLLKNRASELIIQVPVRQLKKIARTEGIGSLQRETQHFVGVTSINGLLRIYRSKGFFRFFWILVTIISFTLLLWQITKLLFVYNSKPTVSQVSFLLPENGLQFPAITICSHNPIRKEYIQRLNSTGHLSQNLLDYAMHSFMEPQYLLSYTKNPIKLKLVDEEWKKFLKNNLKKNFTINSFFWNASTSCQQMLKYCSFGGRQFDCCLYAKGILTDIGKCYQLNFDEADQLWLKHQVQAGMNNGLQIIADAHTEEQISSEIGSGHALSEIFENGFHYYVHDPNAMPYLSTEGISVSPGTKVYSAISPTNYLLLSHKEWGNCTNEWPTNLNKIETNDGGKITLDENLAYSLIKCRTICLAKYFYERCGCSPFIYNIEEYFAVCTPYDTFKCINDGKNKTNNNENLEEKEKNNYDDDEDDYFNKEELPKCLECKIECHRSVYHIYNSYSHGFSQSFLSWIQKKKAEWTPGHVHSNFVAINIFFRDMCYTEYKQIQSVGMTEILSDIGGNMGLFLGMSFISLIEFTTFLWKIFWIFLSKKRRKHMITKKCRDEEREKHLQATMEFALQQHRFAARLGRLDANNNNNINYFEQNEEKGESVPPIASLANPIYSLSPSIDVFQKQRKPSLFNTIFTSNNKRKISSSKKRSLNNLFIESIISNKFYGGESPSSEDEKNEKVKKSSKKEKLVELKIDLNNLEQQNNNYKLRRKSTCTYPHSNLWKRRRVSIFSFPTTTKINNKNNNFPKIKEEID